MTKIKYQTNDEKIQILEHLVELLQEENQSLKSRMDLAELRFKNHIRAHEHELYFGEK